MKNALLPLHKWILGAWALVAIGLAIVGYAVTYDASPEGVLIAFLMVVTFLGLSLFLLGVVWWQIRSAKDDARQDLVAVIGPPFAVGVAVLAMWDYLPL